MDTTIPVVGNKLAKAQENRQGMRPELTLTFREHLIGELTWADHSLLTSTLPGNSEPRERETEELAKGSGWEGRSLPPSRTHVGLPLYRLLSQMTWHEGHRKMGLVQVGVKGRLSM